MRRRDFVNLSSKLAVASILGPRQPRPSGVSEADRGPRAHAPTLEPPWLDAHAHTASAALLGYRAVSGGPKDRRPPTDGAAVIRRMDVDATRRAFVLSTAYQMAADAYGTRTSEAAEYARVRLENDITAAECARYPDS